LREMENREKIKPGFGVAAWGGGGEPVEAE